MLELKGNTLLFSFPEVHPHARCEIRIIRTLRIPDTDRVYDLPPDLGRFPVRHIEDFRERLPAKIVERGGVCLPLYMSEAAWIRFAVPVVPEHHAPYPFAVKVGAGKRSAITGRAWASGLVPGDYVWLPKQPWIDGFVTEGGIVKQFVAMPLGMGTTVEEQLTGAAEFGGIQLEVFPMIRNEFETRYPKWPLRWLRTSTTNSSGVISMPEHRLPWWALPVDEDPCRDFDFSPQVTCSTQESGALSATVLRGTKVARSVVVQSMGMAAGGKMRQEIFADPHGTHVWDLHSKSRCFVHLFNSLAWRSLTGKDPPTAPRTAADYARHNLPWFSHYDEGPVLGGTTELAKVKSLGELQEEMGQPLLPENEDIEPPPKKPQVSRGSW